MALFFFCITQTEAQRLIKLNSSGTTENRLELVKESQNSTVLKLNLNSYKLQSVSTPKGKAFTITTNSGSDILIKGTPDLPKITKSLIVDDNAKMEVEILDAKYIEVADIKIAPSKGSFERSINPKDVSYTYGETYSKDEFFPAKKAELAKAYILRDFRGQTLVLYPFAYNPQKRVLRIYTEMTVAVKATRAKGENALAKTKALSKVDNEFDNMYNRHFINYSNKKSRYTPLGEEGKMLIIAHPDYMEAMNPFIAWKKQRGIEVEMVSMATVGSTANNVKEYVANYYNDNGLTFLLLVGDNQHIPSLNTCGDTDVAYGYISGDDHYPEIIIGRFSAESVADVQTQVQRSVDYEKNPTDGDWYTKYAAIASEEGPGDDGEIDYDHLRNITPDLTGFTYTSGYELFEGSQGGNDQAGDPSAALVAEAINAGVGIINYVGHGGDDNWVTSGFNNNNINNLTNAGKLPFIFSVACVNGNFHNQTCFGEAWLRAKDSDDNPIGAIAIFASTINQHWKPPMAGQDEFNDILTENIESNIKRTYGGICMNGCYKMNEDYPALSGNMSGTEMTDTWTIFGDPSLLIRTAEPTEMTVNHPAEIMIGMGEMQVDCNLNGAIVALTKDGEILSTGKVVNGGIKLEFTGQTEVVDLTITITGFNKKPYIAIVSVIPAAGPYVSLGKYVISGTELNVVNYGQDANLDVKMKNVGVETANNVTATFTTEDEYISITQNTFTYGNIDANAVKEGENALTIKVDDFVPNQHEATIKVKIADNGDHEWTGKIKIKINSPVLDVQFKTLEENASLVFTSSPAKEIKVGETYNYDISVASGSGNGNGSIDAGEIINLKMNSINTGDANAENLTCTLTSESQYVTVNTSSVSIAELIKETPIENAFNVTIADNTPVGTVVDFKFVLQTGEYKKEFILNQKVGLIIEDFESGDFSSYDWQLAGNSNWTIVNSGAYEGTYAAKSGDIDNSQKSELSIIIDVLTADKISFYKKVSAEDASGSSRWDDLEFFIDNVSKGYWDGETDWSKEEFDVTAGEHTFKWVYKKDAYQDAGQDCAWLDAIELPPHTVSSAKNAIVLKATTCPQWLTFTDNGDGTAKLTGISTEDNVGDNAIVLKATKSELTKEQTFNLNVKSTAAISEFTSKESLKVYPNPINENSIISYELEENSIVKISVLDITGKQIKVITNTKQEKGLKKISLQNLNLSKGTYFLRMNVNNNFITKKITIVN